MHSVHRQDTAATLQRFIESVNQSARHDAVRAHVCAPAGVGRRVHRVSFALIADDSRIAEAYNLAVTDSFSTTRRCCPDGVKSGRSRVVQEILAPMLTACAGDASAHARRLPRCCARARPARMGVGPGKLGAEQKDLGGVVHPDQQHDQRTGRAESGRDGALAEIQSDQRLADREEKGGDDRADPDIVPCDFARGMSL